MDESGTIDVKELKIALEAKKNLEEEMYRLKKLAVFMNIVNVAILAGLVTAVVFLSKDFSVEDDVIVNRAGKEIKMRSPDIDVDNDGRMVSPSGEPLKIKTGGITEALLPGEDGLFNVPQTIAIANNEDGFIDFVKVSALRVHRVDGLEENNELGFHAYHGCYTTVNGDFFATSTFLNSPVDLPENVESQVPFRKVESCDKKENYTAEKPEARDLACANAADSVFCEATKNCGVMDKILTRSHEEVRCRLDCYNTFGRFGFSCQFDGECSWCLKECEWAPKLNSTATCFANAVAQHCR